MKYIITGGGSGGHIYPALAIADHIKKIENDSEFLYLGTKNKMESKIVPTRGYDMKFVSAMGMPSSKASFAFFLFLLKLLYGILKASTYIYRFKPDMIIGTGGFVSAPVVFAGAFLRKVKLSKVKIFLHEANSEPGKMIKFAGRYCDGVGTAYKSCLRYFKSNGEYVGFPVREEFFSGNRTKSRELLNISKETFLVVVVGGSQGARTINNGVIDSLTTIKNEGLSNLRIIHATGKNSLNTNVEYRAEDDTGKRFSFNKIDENDYSSFYSRQGYINNIKDHFFAADLIITRGGAGSLTEIAVSSRASIVIPKAGLSGDHQVVNAEYMKFFGASEIIYEHALLEKDKFFIKINGNELAEMIISLYNDRNRIKLMEKSCSSIIDNVGMNEIYNFIKYIQRSKTIVNSKKNNDIIKNISTSSINKRNEYTGMAVSSIVSNLNRKNRDEILKDDNLKYLQYRGSHLFLSSHWQIRNNGVKIAGLTSDISKIPFLSKLFNDKTKASFVHRIMGGDFVQVGFIRRNILISYRQINHFNDTILNDIISGLDDGYYEVIVEALVSIIHFFDKIDDENKIFIKNKMEILLKEKSKNFKIVSETILLYGKLIEEYEEFSIFEPFYFTENHKVREALLSSILLLKNTGIFMNYDRNKKLLDNILLTSSGFIPDFEMKRIIKNIFEG